MKLIKCEKGHFYDEERNTQCPYCAEKGNAQGDAAFGEDSITVDMNSIVRGGSGGPVMTDTSLQEAVIAATNNTEPTVPTGREDPQTVSFFKHSIGVEPVVGWLVCIGGPHFGEDFRLKAGRNFIGRSPSMDVAIVNDSTVSRDRHAVLVYEPRKNLFIAQSGESKELSYLNDDVILSATEIKANDVILVGKTRLMLIPCCSDRFNWDMVQPDDGANRTEGK